MATGRLTCHFMSCPGFRLIGLIWSEDGTSRFIPVWSLGVCIRGIGREHNPFVVIHMHAVDIGYISQDGAGGVLVTLKFIQPWDYPSERWAGEGMQNVGFII